MESLMETEREEISLQKGYRKITDTGQTQRINAENNSRNNSSPVDYLNMIYITLFMAGAGFLLPYNSFVMAVDYFKMRYPDTTIMFDMTMVYITTAFVAVLCNNILVEMLALKTRITFGHLIALLTLLFVAVVEIGWDGFSMNVSYNINLAAIGVVAFGCTVQQSSYYGFTSMLPARYTQAVMAGESAAGFLVSLDRIVTKLEFRDEKESILIFFGLTIILMSFHCVMNYLMHKSNFVQYYSTLYEESRTKIMLEPSEDAELMDFDTSEGNRPNYGILKLQTSPPDSGNLVNSDEFTTRNGTTSSAFSFSNPVYEPNCHGALPTINEEVVHNISGPSFKVEDVLVTIPVSGSIRNKTWKNIKRGFLNRWNVARSIYPFMVTIGLAYFVTISLYPGIVSEIVSCEYGSWMPVIIMFTFNASDLLGKIAASLRYDWSRSQMLMMGILRLLLIPLLLLCATPRGSPHIQGAAYPLLFTILLGLSNGIVGSVPMIQAPSRVINKHRELTGNIMTLSYNVGLTTGSVVAYWLNAILGEPLKNPCSPIYLPPVLVTRPTTSTTTATMATDSTRNIIETTIVSLFVSLQQLNVTNSTSSYAKSFEVSTFVAPLSDDQMDADMIY